MCPQSFHHEHLYRANLADLECFSVPTTGVHSPNCSHEKRDKVTVLITGPWSSDALC